MLEFIMTVAISGAGKTTWAHKYDDTHLVIDSDEMRARLLGDATDQTQNSRVFDEMYRITCNALAAEQSVIYCATNLSSKRRISLIKSLRHRFPNVFYRCVVISAPIEVCRERNSARSRVVPAWVLDKQIRQFQFPLPNEGFDEIKLIQTVSMWDIMTNGLSIWKKVENYGSQHNPHHSLTLLDHCNKCCGYVDEKWPENNDLINAALFHDVGKIYTGIHWDTDEDPETLHYPSHSNYSTVIAMSMDLSIRSLQLISLHMIGYEDEKAQKTWRARAGEDLWVDLEKLFEADRAAH